jgi:hypothetical protein
VWKSQGKVGGYAQSGAGVCTIPNRQTGTCSCKPGDVPLIVTGSGQTSTKLVCTIFGTVTADILCNEGREGTSWQTIAVTTPGDQVVVCT